MTLSFMLHPHELRLNQAKPLIFLKLSTMQNMIFALLLSVSSVVSAMPLDDGILDSRTTVSNVQKYLRFLIIPFLFQSLELSHSPRQCSVEDRFHLIHIERTIADSRYDH